MLFERPAPGQRAALVSVRFTAASGRLDDADSHRDEFGELVRSAGLRCQATVTASREKPHSRWFLGTGKVDELADLVATSDIDVVLFNHELTPAQQRNLEERLACRVMTRTELILHIFADRARTHEGHLQVELAQLTHAQTRLIRGWTHLDRQTGVGGGGGRGAGGQIGGAAARGVGETQLELDQRMLANRVRQVRARLASVQRRRAQSRRRRTRDKVHTVVLAGYTNAGKSTLFNKLTGSDVQAENRLFATLDPTMRRLAGSDSDVVLADTVGFIRALPVTLVEAFKATLEEIAEADLVLHVMDASAADADDLRHHVEVVLAEIGAAEVPTIEVLNKTDLLAPARQRALAAASGRLAVSALTGEGIDKLQEAMAKRLGLTPTTEEIRLPPSCGKLRSWLYRHGQVEQETAGDDGAMVIRVRLPADQLAKVETAIAEAGGDFEVLGSDVETGRGDLSTGARMAASGDGMAR